MMPGYESLWGSEQLSDVEVVLKEDVDEPGTKRKPEVTISGHRIILACNSEFFNAQVTNWSSEASESDSGIFNNGRPAKQQLSMTVPVGQLELGQLLLMSMYQENPDFTELPQDQLLPLLVLADKYGVPKVLTALGSCFETLILELDWEVVEGFYNLPQVIVSNPQCKGVSDAVASKLKIELGDLEKVWASDDKRKMLLQLPYTALKQLLYSDQTKVLSENTAAYTVLQWINAQPDSPERQQQMQELCGLLRMSHCSQLFIATVFSMDATVRSCPSPFQLQIAALCSSQHAIPADYAVLQKYPAWRSQKRATSSVPFPMTIDWGMKFEHIKQVFEDCITSQKPSRFLPGPAIRTHGRFVSFAVRLYPIKPPPEASNPQAGCTHIGIDVHILLVGNEWELARVSGMAMMVPTQPMIPLPGSMRPQAFEKAILLGNLQACRILKKQLLYLPSASWEAAEAKLRQEHCVHSNNYVMMSVHMQSIE